MCPKNNFDGEHYYNKPKRRLEIDFSDLFTGTPTHRSEGFPVLNTSVTLSSPRRHSKVILVFYIKIQNLIADLVTSLLTLLFYRRILSFGFTPLWWSCCGWMHFPLSGLVSDKLITDEENG